jgi:hypothetical protein
LLPHTAYQITSPLGATYLTMVLLTITTVQLIATAFGAALAGLVANLAGMTNPGGVAGA